MRVPERFPLSTYRPASLELSLQAHKDHATSFPLSAKATCATSHRMTLSKSGGISLVQPEFTAQILSNKKSFVKFSIILLTTKHTTETINLEVQRLQGCQNDIEIEAAKSDWNKSVRPSLCVWSELGIASHAKSVTAH